MGITIDNPFRKSKKKLQHKQNTRQNKNKGTHMPDISHRRYERYRNFSEKFHLEESIVEDVNSLVPIVLDFFYDTTRIPILFWNFKHEPYEKWCSSCYNGFNPICQYMKSKHNLWNLCIENHKLRRNQFKIMATDHHDHLVCTTTTCHLGLRNINLPIYMHGELLGVLMAGQYHKNCHDCDKAFSDRISELSSEKHVNETDILTLSTLHKFNSKNNNESSLESSQSILLKCAKHIKLILLLLESRIEDTSRKITLVRHELQNPQTTIKNYSLDMIDKLYPIAHTPSLHGNQTIPTGTLNRLLEESQIIYNNSVLSSTTIENIFTTYTGANIPIVEKRFDIVKLIKETASLFSHRAKLKHITINPIHFDSAIEPQTVILDKTHITRALINAYDNSIKYSYKGIEEKKHWIDTRICEDKLSGTNKTFIKLQISNFGVAILKEEIDSGIIWLPGRRGKLAKDRNRIGSGLGLWQIRQILKAHGGHAEIESRPVTEQLNGRHLVTLTLYIPFAVSGGL